MHNGVHVFVRVVASYPGSSPCRHGRSLGTRLGGWYTGLYPRYEDLFYYDVSTPLLTPIKPQVYHREDIPLIGATDQQRMRRTLVI